jgi:hypothetical protein
MAETKKSAIARNAVISRVSELDICSVRTQESPQSFPVQQALIACFNTAKDPEKLRLCGVFSCPEIFDCFHGVPWFSTDFL